MASRFAFKKNKSSTDEDLPRPQDFIRFSGEQGLTCAGDRREARQSYSVSRLLTILVKSVGLIWI